MIINEYTIGIPIGIVNKEFGETENLAQWWSNLKLVGHFGK